MTQTQSFYIGLMSGTSLDGIDAVLARFNTQSANVVRHLHIDYPASLKDQFFSLLTPADNELARAQQAQHQRTDLANKLIDKLCNGLDRAQIMSIADHGQTIRHFPNNTPPYSIQLHQGARLAKLTGITTVVDFRSKDIADGGQGAPLAPAFHQAFFSDPQHYRMLINIGGIANISLLPPSGSPGSLGFDTGPGNTLLDLWSLQHTGEAYDDQGQWAASGRVNEPLLKHLLDEDYFRLTPPKSTGREKFNLEWLNQKLKTFNLNQCPHKDVQATLSAYTVRTIFLGITQICQQAGINRDAALEGIYVCGGGAYNTHLMQALQQQSNVPVQSSDSLGVPPQQVEATAFAWLGKTAITNQAIDLRQTTGATHANILGAIYPA